MMIKAVDMFCGAGGATHSLMKATPEQKLDVVAINHWERAIETHSANHPWAEHICTGIESVKPSKVVPGGYLDMLLAGPECTHHSNARGGKPRDDQSRASAWHICHWAQELYIKHIVVENVPEFLNWGPLTKKGKPMKRYKGKTFKAFVESLRSLGYQVEWRILTAADYGDATTRQRFFLQARRGGRGITWPEPTHTPETYKPARDIIDWFEPTYSVFLTKDECKARGLPCRRPLSPNTIKRIEAGIRKFWGDWAEPFLLRLHGTSDVHLDSSALPIDGPLPTISAGGQHVGMVQPFLVKYHGGRDMAERCYPLGAPLGTLDCSNRFGIVQPFILNQDQRGRNRGVDEPIPTVTRTGAHALVQPFLVKFYGRGAPAVSLEDPLGTITAKDRFGLVAGDGYTLDIGFRMLTPRELARAHSFPDDYVFCGGKMDKVAQIGNSWPTEMGCAVASQGVA